MPRAVIRKAVYQRISPAIVEYTCETCGKACGTGENPKETWYARGDSKYYCKRTCSPAGCRGAWYDRRHRKNCYYCTGEDVMEALSR
jgi:hypothetical protein